MGQKYDIEVIGPTPVESGRFTAELAASLLGASTWPRARGLNGGPSFARSAQEIKTYLREPALGLGLSEEVILWLFDSDISGPNQVDEVGVFLQKRTRESNGLQDVVVYYVGHGSFPEASNQFFMLVRTSDPDHWDTTCILASSLARRIRSVLPFARQVVILDCCFSGAAVKDWQSASAAQGIMLRASIEESVPSTGAVLICSSASEMVSMAPPGASHTMFTGALLEGLRAGNPTLGRVLNARDAGDLAWLAMQARWKSRAVRPVVVPIDRGHGDISRIGVFPNPAAFPDFLSQNQQPSQHSLSLRAMTRLLTRRWLLAASVVVVLGSVLFSAGPNHWGGLFQQPPPDKPDNVIDNLASRYSPERVNDYFNTTDPTDRRRKRDNIDAAKLSATDYAFAQWSEEWWRDNVGGAGVKGDLPMAIEGVVGGRQTPGDASKASATRMSLPLFDQMKADRDVIRESILDGLRKADFEYPLERALIDVADYYQAGNFASAVAISPSDIPSESDEAPPTRLADVGPG